MATDRNEYESFKGLLNGNAQILDKSILLDCVAKKTLTDLGSADFVYVLHDPCDIRKPYSSGSEHLGTVLSLQKKAVSGYSSFNSVAVIPEEQKVHLLCNELYSNTLPSYVNQEVVNLVKSNKVNTSEATLSKEDLLDKKGRIISEEKQELVKNNNYLNGLVIAKNMLKKSSDLLKKDHSFRKVCHVLDREFDNNKLFETIDKQEDFFIIRLKINRLSNEKQTIYTKKGNVSKRVSFKKLIDKKFKNNSTYEIPKLTIKGKRYNQVQASIEWESVYLGGKKYQVVRVSLSQFGKPLFDHPMLLLTNQSINNSKEASQVYHGYILRFKIEVVFRFLKQNLGWESFQVRDFKSIENLLAIAFFLVGYYKELEEELKQHPLATFLCKLAFSKGKITLFFLLAGLEKIVHFQQVKQWMLEENISQDQLDELVKQLNFTQ